MKPGSVLWLLKFEWTLYFRNLLSGSQKWAIGVLVLIVLIGAGTLWNFLREYNDVLTSMPATLSPTLALPLTLVGGVLFVVMFMTGLQASVQVMFERKDLDLLVSSPVSTRSIFAVRVLGVVMAVSLWWVTFGFLVALIGLMLGSWHLLGLPLGFLTLGMVVSTVSVGISFALVRAFGVQKTRTIVQVTTFVFGGLMFMVSQLQNFMRAGSTPAWMQNLSQWVVQTYQSLLALPETSLLWYWARSLWLEPLPTLMVLAGSLAVLTLMVTITHGAYLKGASEASGFNRPRLKNLKQAPFRSGGLLLLWSKEWKLVLRDPALLAQLVLQVVYLVPLMFMMFGMNSGARQANAFAALLNPAFWVAGVVLAASSLASWVARVFIAAEDQPDLLAMSPHPVGHLRRQKMWVVLAPMLMVFVPLVLFLARGKPMLMVLGAGALVICLTLIALMQMWWAKPIRRADLMNKNGKGQGDPLQGFMEAITYMGWAGAIAAYGQGSTKWTLIALGVGIFFPVVLALLNRGKASALGY